MQIDTSLNTPQTQYKRNMPTVKKPVYRVFGDIGSTREFDNKKYWLKI